MNEEEVIQNDLSQQLSDLIEVLQTEQELQAEEKAKIEEQQAQLEKQEKAEQKEQEEQKAVEEEFRQAVLTSLENVNPTGTEQVLQETKEILLEIKEMKEIEMQAMPNFYWGANSLIIYACLIPLFMIVRWFGKGFRG